MVRSLTYMYKKLVTVWHNSYFLQLTHTYIMIRLGNPTSGSRVVIVLARTMHLAQIITNKAFLKEISIPVVTAKIVEQLVIG